MLTAKGYAVAFKLAEVRNLVRAPRSYALLYDPSGEDWPKDDVLVAPFSPLRGEVQDDEAERYFGYVPRKGKLHPPSRNLKNWIKLGEVDAIDYTRPGENAGDFRHDFAVGDAGGLYYLFPGVKPVLYKQTRMLLLHFQDGCVINWRGFVWP